MKFHNKLFEYDVPQIPEEFLEIVQEMLGLDERPNLADLRQFARQFLFRRPEDPSYVRPQVPDIGLPDDLDYLIAIDDSGNSEPMLTRKGHLSPREEGLPTLGVLGIKVDELKLFNNDWIDYREWIREYLNLSETPIIHALHMHGADLKPKAHGKRNPFYDVPINKRHFILEMGERLIFEHTFGDKAALSLAFGKLRSSSLKKFNAFMYQTNLIADIRYLQAQSNRNWLKIVTKRLSNPLSSAVLNAMQFLDLALERLGGKRAGIIFDNFDAVSGITDDFIDEVLESTLEFKNIKWVKILKNAHEYPLLQAADVLAFRLRRERQEYEGLIGPRTSLNSIGPIGDETVKAAMDEFEELLEAQDMFVQIGFQYRMLYQEVKTLDPKLYARLADPNTFEQRLSTCAYAGTRVSIFEDDRMSALFIPS